MSQLLIKNIINKKDKSRQHTHRWFGHGQYARLLSLTDENTVVEIRYKLHGLLKKTVPPNVLKWNAITEKIPPKKIIRMFADLDFKPETFSKEPDFHRHIATLIHLYKQTVERCIDSSITEWYVATRMLYKFHIHFPTVIVSTTQAKQINEEFREAFKQHEQLKEFYSDSGVDSSVYSTGLRMLWCHKGNMIKEDDLQNAITEHLQQFPNVPYEYCYYLIDPESLKPLEPKIVHLERCSIITDDNVNCTVTVTAVPQEIVKTTKEQFIVTNQETDASTEVELSEEAKMIVRKEIVTRWTCYEHSDINKIIDFRNYIIAAITKKTCPIKGGEHSKNHPYAVICADGIRIKCHNVQCSTVVSNIYPISIELQKFLEESGKRLIPYAEGYLIKNILSQIYIPQWHEDKQSAFTAYLNNYLAMYVGPYSELMYLYRETPETPWLVYSKEKIRERLNKFNTAVQYTDNDQVKTHHIRIYETWMTNINRREINTIVLDTRYIGDDPEHPNIWNVWTGFKARPAKVWEEEIIAPVLYHIKQVYCAGDEIKYNYFLDWLAHLVKQPSKKIGTAIMLKGVQGTGKNVILDWLGREVIGCRHYTEYNSMEELNSRFNSDSEYKILIICNEISNFGGCIKTNDTLKNKITNQKVRIERKGIDPVSGDDFSNYIFTSNNSWTLRITADDRRYNVFETSPIHKGDMEYFSNLIECLERPETADAFLGYLFSRRLNCICRREYVNDKSVPLRNVHEALWTDEKREMMMFSKESIVTFVEKLLLNEVKISSISHKGDELKVGSKELYQSYCTFHDEGNYFQRKLDEEVFAKAFSKETEKYPGRFLQKKVGPSNKRRRGYLIYTETLLTASSTDGEEEDSD